MPGNKSHVTGERGGFGESLGVSNTIRFVEFFFFFFKGGERQVRDRGTTTSMSRSFFLVPPSSFVVCPFWAKVVFFSFLHFVSCGRLLLLLLFSGRCPVSLLLLLLFFCLVRSEQQQKRWTITLSLSVLPAEWMAEETGQKKGEKLPTGTQAVRMRAGAFVWRASILSLLPLSLPPTLLFMTGPGPCRRRRRLP